MLLVQRANGGRGRWNDIVDEEEEGVLGTQLDALTNQKVKLAHSQIRGDEILLLVQVANASIGCLLHDHLDEGEEEDTRH